MKLNEITKHITLLDSEGWQIIDFKKSNGDSNYNYALENSEFCIAWISTLDKITAENLAKINFHREDPFKKGINLYRPLFLIATNGRNWYISTPQEPTFVRKDLNSIKELVLNGLKECLSFYKEKKYDSKSIENMKRSILQLNRMIKKKSEPVNYTGIQDPFASAGDWKEFPPENYKAMYEVNLTRTTVLEKILNAKLKEASDLSILMHTMLFKTFNLVQLRAMLQIISPNIYLNPWYNNNEILVKTSQEDLYANTTMKMKTDNVFYIIEKSGDIIKMEIDIDDSLDKLKPGFFKLDKEIVYTFLEKNTNGK